MNRLFPQIYYNAPDGNGGGGASPSSAPSPSAAGSSDSSSPSGAAPSTTPSSEPSASPSTPPSSDNSSDAFDGVGFSSDFGGMFEEIEVPAATTAPDTTPAQPAAPPTAQPEVVPPAAAPPPQSQAQPQATPTAEPAPAPQPSSPPLSVGDPAALADLVQQNEAALIDHVAQHHFQLSQEDIEALETDATAAIPKLLARGLLRSQTATMRMIAQQVPRMIAQYQAVSKANNANETKFFTRWPDIKPEVHGDIVKRIGFAYRQANPNAPLEQMIEELGPMVMQVAKITPTQQQAQNPMSPPMNGRTPPPSPFVPAAPGVGGSPLTAPEPGIWDGLGASHDG